MPVAYAIAPESGVVYVALIGRIEGAAIMDATATLYADPAWENDYDMVWDGSEISELALTPADTDGFMQQAAHNVAAGHAGRIAVVVNREVVELIAHLYRHRLGAMGRPFELFDTLNAAAGWLSLQEGVLQRLRHRAHQRSWRKG